MWLITSHVFAMAEHRSTKRISNGFAAIITMLNQVKNHMTVSKFTQPFITVWSWITARYTITKRWLNQSLLTRKTWIRLLQSIDAVKMSIVWATELVCIGSSIALMVLSVHQIYSADVWHGIASAFVALWMILVLLLINYYTSPDSSQS